MLDSTVWQWDEAEWRDSDGDKCRLVTLTHSTGRVFAAVGQAGSTALFRALFYCKLPAKVATAGDCRFISVQAAKRFAEEVLESFDPFASIKLGRVRKAASGAVRGRERVKD